MIGDEEVWGRVERVRVENRIVGSLPGSGMDQRGRREEDKRAGGGRRRRWKWTEEDKREFRERIALWCGRAKEEKRRWNGGR